MMITTTVDTVPRGSDTKMGSTLARGPLNPTSSPELTALRERFASTFFRIRQGAIERDEGRLLPYDDVKQLQESGFTGLRVPVEFGGSGVSLSTFIELLFDLSIADSNVAHLLRGHVVYTEQLLLRAPSTHRDGWLRRIAEGQLIGNAASERQELTEITTQLTRTTAEGNDADAAYTVTGTKYYTTGSIYADWIALSALLDGERHSVIVNAHHPGVKIRDDWDGFGQQLTASGGLSLDSVPVESADIRAQNGEDPHTGFFVSSFQTILLVVAAGIGQSAVDDAVAFVKPRRRTFAHPGEQAPREEDLVQNIVGRVSAQALAARRLVSVQAQSLSDYADTFRDGLEPDSVESSTLTKANQLALTTFQTQEVVLDLVLRTTSEIFDVGGASATSTRIRLDRHWRNARTLASHNPVPYRLKAVGNYLLNDEFLLWGKSSASSSSESTTQQTGQREQRS